MHCVMCPSSMNYSEDVDDWHAQCVYIDANFISEYSEVIKCHCVRVCACVCIWILSTERNILHEVQVIVNCTNVNNAGRKAE